MLNVTQLIESGGLLLIGLIVFAESGLLVGFFLPGDTLLFTAGFFAAQGKLPLAWLLLTVITAAIIGDNVGYEIGKRSGKRLFTKNDGLLFRKEHVLRAEEFYKAHGGKTIILARFIPVIRTFAPMVAGIGKMSHRRFFLFNVFGGIGWGAGVILLGHWLGSKIPNIDKYLLPVILLAMALTFAPTLYHVFKDKKTRVLLWQRITTALKFNK